ncbi:MAG: hypothetical protein JST83_11560, partial [Bacteroidetes bacterium]|nr:hypothetical protein [Bacteroidota bacterium]
GGGGGGTAYSSFTVFTGGGGGGGGGTDGGGGSNYYPGGGGGGGGSASSGAAEGGSSGSSQGGGGGTGGAAGTGTGYAGSGGGSGGGSSGYAGGAFGVHGGGNYNNAGDVGSSGAGGQVSISGVGSVNISGKISGLATITGSTGFTGLSYSGDSVNVMGTGGTINISVTAPSVTPVYFADANYGSGASTYLVNAGGITITGDLHGSAANTVTLNSVVQASQIVTGPISMGGVTATILEGANTVTIGPGSMVTPAEFIAFLQKSVSGTQSLILSQTTNGTSPGTGYASGGDFTVASINIPATNFTNLVLPSGVTENVTAPSITYNGNATVNGIINLGSTTTAMNVAGNTALGGTINFNNTAGGLLNSTGSITGAGTVSTTGTLTLQSIGNIYGTSAANPLTVVAPQLSILGSVPGNSLINVRTNSDVRLLNSSGYSFTFTTPGNITIAGDINSLVTPGSSASIATTGGNIFEDGSTPGRLYFTDLGLSNSTNGSVGTAGAPILVRATNMSVSGGGTGTSYISATGGISLSASGLTTLDVVGTSSAGQFSVGGGNIVLNGASSFANINFSQGSSSIVINGNLTASTVALQSGTGNITGGGTVAGSTRVDITTQGGFIGASAALLQLNTPILTLDTHNTGNVYVANSANATISSGSFIGSHGIFSLVYQGQGAATGVSVGSAGITASGPVSLTNPSGTNFGIDMTGNIQSNDTVTLTAKGTGTLSGTGLVRGSTVTLNASTSNGTIGSAASRFNVQTGNLAINANNIGSQYLRNQIAGTVVSTNGVGTLDYMAGDTITVGSTGISGSGNINLYGSSGSNTGISLGGLVQSTAPAGIVNLQATGSGSISQTVATTTVQANTVNLSTAGRDIGSAGQAIRISAPISTAATGLSGDVWISNDVGTQFTTNSSSVHSLVYTSTGTFNVGSAGILAQGGATITAQSINLGGNVSVGSATATLETTGGSITGIGTIIGDTARLMTAGGSASTIGASGSALQVDTNFIYLDT